jgi:hypothetical protein
METAEDLQVNLEVTLFPQIGDRLLNFVPSAFGYR